MVKVSLLVSLVSVLLLSGCGNNNLYYWGQYENIVRQSYVAPDEVDTRPWSRVV